MDIREHQNAWGEIRFFTRFELLKMARQGRVLIGLAVLLFFMLMCGVGAEARLYELDRRGRHHLERRNIQEVINTVSFSIHCLPPAMDVLFPILIGIFSAAIFAGEYETNLMRTQAIRPISRSHLLLGKLLAMTIYVGGFLLILWAFSFVTGAILFTLSSDVYIWKEPFDMPRGGLILPESTAWGRYFMVFPIALVTILAQVPLFMVFSVVFKKFTPAAAVPIGLYFVSLALEKMPIFRPVRSYLPTYYFGFWKYVVHPIVPWDLILHNAVIMVVMAVLALFVAMTLFKSADI